jgi:tetratricopeptide (TPR) repeat protein
MSAAIRGTEFHIEVAPNGRTVLTLLDGEVDVTNDFGPLTLHSGEQATVEPGAAPKRTAVLDITNVIQWCLYYPAVLNPGELAFTADETNRLRDSMAAYRAGDLPGAVALYPEPRAPSEAERIYRAALWLSIGDVSRAETVLGGAQARAAESLRRMMAVVQNRAAESASQPATATEWMVESYFEQSRSHLEAALDAARRARTLAPEFGFAWSRVAELEFSFGRRAAAEAALNKALAISPRNAQAWSLRGFILAAENKSGAAREAFDHALALDNALPTAWLGRGLMSIHTGHVTEGRRDLQAAAALQPNRAVLRSYLGKAFAEEDNAALANKELKLAERMDVNDPTASLYAALLHQQENRINEAVAELERSKELNNNRSLFRSQLLLDEDRAVRGANLAAIYRDAGMTHVAEREASRSVISDYADFSSHLFLANSYNALRDPRQVNLRFESAFLGEYLIANLLAPSAAGSLSPQVSEQEYTRLFERNGVGLVSSTEYFSRGDWVQSASHYGTFDQVSYALEEDYRSERGAWHNEDLEQLTLSFRYKMDLTASDSLYVQVVEYRDEAGDVAQRFSPLEVNPGLRTKEREDPLLVAGLHHEWAPGSHTLALFGYLPDTLKVRNPYAPLLLVGKDNGNVLGTGDTTAPQFYRSDLTIYSGELQQIWQREPGTLIAGGRVQAGEFDTRNWLSRSAATSVGGVPGAISTPRVQQDVSPELERYSAYGYYYWRVAEPLLLIGGVSYDRLTAPRNFRSAPIESGTRTTDQVSPKAGLIWTVAPYTHVRSAYTRSLGGASFDQSVRIEPTEIAGFNQTFRSLAPESLVGSLIGEEFTTYSAGIDHKFSSRTYLGLDLEWLESSTSERIGTFDVTGLPPAAAPSNTKQKLDFTERSLLFTLNQLIADHWSVGALYRLGDAELKSRLPAIPESVSTAAHGRDEALLHQIDLFLLFNHESGFFARGDALFTAQDNDSHALDNEAFWQLNLFAGYRFPRRRAELTLAVLNVTGANYRLNPLSLYPDLPRERTFACSLKLNF